MPKEGSEHQPAQVRSAYDQLSKHIRSERQCGGSNREHTEGALGRDARRGRHGGIVSSAPVVRDDFHRGTLPEAVEVAPRVRRHLLDAFRNIELQRRDVDVGRIELPVRDEVPVLIDDVHVGDPVRRRRRIGSVEGLHGMDGAVRVAHHDRSLLAVGVDRDEGSVLLSVVQDERRLALEGGGLLAEEIGVEAGMGAVGRLVRRAFLRRHLGGDHHSGVGGGDRHLRSLPKAVQIAELVGSQGRHSFRNVHHHSRR
mmetsp:Transcript_23602/g.43609  ORF Transcript_23602/g.43609 Transcript_23602/m.43609 type:complete len:255 (-) Transcript_23602:495-1259(-)